MLPVQNVVGIELGCNCQQPNRQAVVYPVGKGLLLAEAGAVAGELGHYIAIFNILEF